MTGATDCTKGLNPMTQRPTQLQCNLLQSSAVRLLLLYRSMKAQHDAATQQELATWREQQQMRAAAKATARRSFANQVAWQLVQLAERLIEYRAATAGQQVPRRDWRAWLALFKAGDEARETQCAFSCMLMTILLDTGQVY